MFEQLNTGTQQVLIAGVAGGLLLVVSKFMMSLYKHLPVKYAEPQANAKPPQAPAEVRGSFHSSYDGTLWLFEREWIPKGEIKATLRILHGTVDHSGVYDELANKLASVGVAVFASDMRGWGLSDGEQLYFNDIEAFVEDVRVDHLRVHADPRFSNVKHRFLLGKSLGGLIAAHTVARHPDLFSGLIGLSGAFEISSVLPPAPIMLLLRLLAAVLPKLPLKPAFKPELIVSDKEALCAWEKDTLVARGKVTVTYITTIAAAADSLQSMLPLLSVPMLMMWGTDDKVVSDVGHADMVGKSGGTDKEFKQYEGAFHNILAEPTCKDQAMQDIQQWILNRCA